MCVFRERLGTAIEPSVGVEHDELLPVLLTLVVVQTDEQSDGWRDGWVGVWADGWMDAKGNMRSDEAGCPRRTVRGSSQEAGERRVTYGMMTTRITR